MRSIYVGLHNSTAHLPLTVTLAPSNSVKDKYAITLKKKQVNVKEIALETEKDDART